jgi:hypothetical protein
LRTVTATLFAMLLLCATAVRAQDAEPQLLGRVTEVGSGAPIAGATVTLVPSIIAGNLDFQSAETDQDGYYRFMTVREGAYTVHASRDGFLGADYATDASPDGAFLRFDSSARFKRIDIQLQPESAIRGSVTNDDGKPIANVTVAAVRQSNAMKNRLVPASSATTDSSGHFEIKKLSAGAYLVCASGPNGYGDPPYATHWYRQKWFDNADSSDAATPILLQEREVRTDVRITTSDEKRYRIIVWPLSPEGAAVPDRFDLLLANRNYASTRQADGSYIIFDIPPGHYTLIINSWSQVQYLGEGEQSFDVVDSDVTLRIHLGRLGEIAGVVQWLRPPKAIPNQALFMIESEEGAAQGVTVDKQGRFDITRVLPGKYLFKPFAVHPFAVPQSVICRGQNIGTGSPLVIRDRDEVLDCTVILAQPK